jgi:hypothetical protein
MTMAKEGWRWAHGRVVSRVEFTEIPASAECVSTNQQLADEEGDQGQVRSGCYGRRSSR